VGFVETGAHISASGRGRVRAYAGEAITTNPGEVHDGQPLGIRTRRWRILSVDPQVMASLVASDRADLEITRPVIADAELVHALKRLFRRIDASCAGRGSASALAGEEALVETCVLLMSRYGTLPLRPDVGQGDVRRVRDRLADETKDPPTLAELAATVGLSRYQVLRRFERVYGIPPHAWLRSRRVEQARALIRKGASLASAAAAAGFADQSHMTRVFVRHYGFTPGAWRDAAAPQ
jgi:AraC-like DNA-binding protein